MSLLKKIRGDGAPLRIVILGHFLSSLIGLVILARPGWSFPLFPTLIGALIVVAVALFYNNVTRETANPKYW